jgi:hypothetical protein
MFISIRKSQVLDRLLERTRLQKREGQALLYKPRTRQDAMRMGLHTTGVQNIMQ